MNEEQSVGLLNSVTPDRVRRLTYNIEARQPSANRGTAPLYEVIEALTQGLPARSAREQAAIERHMREAIIAAVSQIEGMTFIEGDS